MNLEPPVFLKSDNYLNLSIKLSGSIEMTIVLSKEAISMIAY